MNARRRARVRAGVVGAVLAAALAGCGVSVQDEPEPIDPTSLRPVPTPTITVVPDTTPAQGRPRGSAPVTSASPSS